MEKYIVKYKDGSEKKFNAFENFLISELLINLDKKKYGREVILARQLGEKLTKEFDFWLDIPKINTSTLLSYFSDAKIKELNYILSIYSKQKAEKQQSENLQDIAFTKIVYKLEEEKVGEDIKIEKKIKTLKDFIYG